jgi:heptosyltransferase-2
MKNVLVIRPGALGDAVLTLPALAHWKRAGAKAFTILATPASWRFLSPLCTDISILDFGAPKWAALFSDAPLPDSIQKQLAAFDSAILYLNADGECVCERLRAAGIADVKRIEPPMAGMAGSVHAAERLCPDRARSMMEETMREEEACIDRWLESTPEEIVAARLLLDFPPGAPYCVIHPGSGGRKKCWPARNYLLLARSLSARLKCNIVVCCGEAEADLIDHFSAQIDDAGMRLIMQKPLREVLAILRGARFFVGNDSGISHLAARVCRVLALFGPTSPDVWRPLGRAVKTVLAPNGELSKLEVADALTQCLELVPRSETPAC